MRSPSRRRILQLAGTALGGGVAGCLGGGQSSRLGELAVTNHDTRPHPVHVLVVEGGDPVYWSSKRVPAATEDVVGTARFEDYPTDVETHRLYARLSRQSLSTAERFEFADYDADCISIQLEVGEERNPPELSLWYTTDTDLCNP